MIDQIYILIPAYKEQNLKHTLVSLSACSVADVPVKIKILINGSQADTEEVRALNLKVFQETREWIDQYVGPLKFEVISKTDLPAKTAGVGLARKILGDAAVLELKEEKMEGVLAYLDADCTVSKNYLQVVYEYFNTHPVQAASIYFEHQIQDFKNDRNILEYELHLRYYIEMQRQIGLPYAIHTVGSSMAVLASAYTAKGGMNKRKAGEDFYFLHKFIKDEVCGNITAATVYPSSRESDRVPFGTGRAMLKYKKESGFKWLTYPPIAFEILSQLLEGLPEMYQGKIDFTHLNAGLQEFLKIIKAREKIEEISNNVSSQKSFIKRFYQFFDAFMLMKYLHFMRDEYNFEEIPIHDALSWLMKPVLEKDDFVILYQHLEQLRERERKFTGQC